MTGKTTNKFSPEVRARAVRMVLDHASEHSSRWAAVTSIAAKIGCTPQTLHDWVKKAEIDSGRLPLPSSSCLEGIAGFPVGSRRASTSTFRPRNLSYESEHKSDQPGFICKEMRLLPS
jgi:transposase-like protein